MATRKSKNPQIQYVPQQTPCPNVFFKEMATSCIQLSSRKSIHVGQLPSFTLTQILIEGLFFPWLHLLLLTLTSTLVYVKIGFCLLSSDSHSTPWCNSCSSPPASCKGQPVIFSRLKRGCAAHYSLHLSSGFQFCFNYKDSCSCCC